MDCAGHCLREFCCRSANIRNIAVSDGSENCELLHALAEEEPGKLKTNDIYDYLVVGRGEVSKMLKLIIFLVQIQDGFYMYMTRNYMSTNNQRWFRIKQII